MCVCIYIYFRTFSVLCYIYIYIYIYIYSTILKMFCAVCPCFTTYNPELSGDLQVPTHTCRLRSYLQQEKKSLHLRHILLTVTDTSCHKTPVFFPCQPPRCLTDSLILYYILFCTSLFSLLPESHLSLCLFSCFHSSLLPHLIFLPASTSSPVMHCCRGHLLCPSLFMIATFSTLAQ